MEMKSWGEYLDPRGKQLENTEKLNNADVSATPPSFRLDSCLVTSLVPCSFCRSTCGASVVASRNQWGLGTRSYAVGTVLEASSSHQIDFVEVSSVGIRPASKPAKPT
jgi:hypothetical protein